MEYFLNVFLIPLFQTREHSSCQLSSKMLTSEIDDSLLNVAAEQSEELLRLHQLQLKLLRQELITTRTELQFQRSTFDREKIEQQQQHQESTQSLRVQISEVEDTLRLRDAELSATQTTLNLRNDNLESIRIQLKASNERARLAEENAYDAKIKYKALSEQLSRQHMQNALDFQEKLTGAFEQKLQKIKLKHTQDVFLAKRNIAGGV